MSILIGLHIKAVLNADPVVTRQCGNRIYPVAVTQQTPAFPCLVYKNQGTGPDETKDGSASDSCQVMLVLVHESYEEGLSLLNHIRYLYESRHADYPLFSVKDCSMNGYSEEYDMDINKYVFTLNFNFTTIDL